MSLTRLQGPVALAIAVAFSAWLGACDGTPASGDADTPAQADAADAGFASDSGAVADSHADLPGEDGPLVEPVAFCEGATAHRYDPLASSELEMFPDDILARPDPTSPTGLRLDPSPERAPWVLGVADLLRPSLEQMGVLSGSGTSAAVVLRFTGPVAAPPATAEDSVTSDAVAILDLSTDPPTRVPFEARLNDGDKDLILWPLRPMRPGTRHAAIVTSAFSDADGNCIAPGPVMRSLLDGTASVPLLAELVPRYAEALAAAGLEPGDVSAMTVFTTHDDLAVIRAVAVDVRTRSYSWDGAPACEDKPDHVRCEGRFDAWDYRDDRILRDADPASQWSLPVSIWLPPASAGAGPHPVIISGHGINGGRQGDGGAIARRVNPLGFAVVAVDALEHNDHPTTLLHEGGDDTLSALRFLGLDLENLSIDVLALRGNFDQSLVDRLQLVELIRQAPDVNGDGSPDLDIGRLGYWGISLGGMMGAPFLAACEEARFGLLSVAGGRLLTFATDNAMVEPFKFVLINLIGSEAEMNRLLAVAQALVDPADPATYALSVLQDRWYAGPAPSVLMQVSVSDETVPPAAGRALARALGLPQIPRVVEQVSLLDTAPPPPVSGNVAGGAATAGFVQLDQVGADGSWQEATHGNTPFSPQAEAQALRFLERWRDLGVAEITDAYAGSGPPP